MRRKCFLCSTGKRLEGNSQDTTQWHFGETNLTSSPTWELLAQVISHQGGLLRAEAASYVEHHRRGRQYYRPSGCRETLESIPGHGARSGGAGMLCHPSLQGPLAAHQLDKSVGASQTMGTLNLCCFRDINKSIPTGPLKYMDYPCNTF